MKINNGKIILFLFTFFIFIMFIDSVSAQIVTLNEYTRFPGQDIVVRVRPTNDGFYNVIQLFKGNNLVAIINVNCATICTADRNVRYTIPSNFFGDYYFAIFDYNTNDYETESFLVMEPDGSQSGTLTIFNVTSEGTNINGVVNPDAGKRANLTINTEFRRTNCQNFPVKAILCNSSIAQNCSRDVNTHHFNLTLQRRQNNRCFYAYADRQYFPFYESPGNWTFLAYTGSIEQMQNFTYTKLTAINYTNAINFGSLNAQTWNVGIPVNGTYLTNFGNTPLRVDWSSNGFNCISVNCTDFWASSSSGEDRFQIDDDNLFLEQNETQLNPVFVTNYSVNYFPQMNLSRCISYYCNNSIGENIKTYFNLKIPSIQRGNYRGNITIRLT